MPQSNSNFLPAASTKYLDPVTVPAAPRKVSFGIVPHCTQCVRRFDNRPFSIPHFFDFVGAGLAPPGRSDYRDCSASRRSNRAGASFYRALDPPGTHLHPSIPHEIQRPLQLHLKLRPARQIDFVPAPRLHHIRRNRRRHRAFRNFFLIVILYAFHRAHRRSRRRSFRSRLLRAHPSLAHTLLLRPTASHAVIAGHRNNFRHDRQRPKIRLNVVKRQPDFRASCDARRLHAADVPDNFGTCRQINSAPRLQRLQRPHLEPTIAPRSLRVQFIFQLHQESRPRHHCIRLDRQLPTATPVRRLRQRMHRLSRSRFICLRRLLRLTSILVLILILTRIITLRRHPIARNHGPLIVRRRRRLLLRFRAAWETQKTHGTEQHCHHQSRRKPTHIPSRNHALTHPGRSTARSKRCDEVSDRKSIVWSLCVTGEANARCRIFPPSATAARHHATQRNHVGAQQAAPQTPSPNVLRLFVRMICRGPRRDRQLILRL